VLSSIFDIFSINFSEQYGLYLWPDLFVAPVLAKNIFWVYLPGNEVDTIIPDAIASKAHAYAIWHERS
jgi:hypothetical protein